MVSKRRTRPDTLDVREVGVGIMIAHNPLHGSGRADFPHPALALGDNAHAPQRIGMTDRRHRQPASDDTPHAIPVNAAYHHSLAACDRMRRIITRWLPVSDDTPHAIPVNAAVLAPPRQ